MGFRSSPHFLGKSVNIFVGAKSDAACCVGIWTDKVHAKFCGRIIHCRKGKLQLGQIGSGKMRKLELWSVFANARHGCFNSSYHAGVSLKIAKPVRWQSTQYFSGLLGCVALFWSDHPTATDPLLCGPQALPRECRGELVSLGPLKPRGSSSEARPGTPRSRRKRAPDTSGTQAVKAVKAVKAANPWRGAWRFACQGGPCPNKSRLLFGQGAAFARRSPFGGRKGTPPLPLFLAIRCQTNCNHITRHLGQCVLAVALSRYPSMTSDKSLQVRERGHLHIGLSGFGIKKTPFSRSEVTPFSRLLPLFSGDPTSTLPGSRFLYGTQPHTMSSE